MRKLLWLPIAALMACDAASAQETNGLSAVEQRISNLEAQVSYRIVGGVVAKDKAWPWQVIFFENVSGGYIYCGGSIINRKWILTAAHCIESTNPDQYALYEETNTIAGPSKTPGHRLFVRRVIRHENYSSTTSENDIALLELSNEATSQAIELSFPEGNILEKQGSLATVTGWGTLRATVESGKQTVDLLTHEAVRPGDPKYYTNRLMEVEVPLVDEDTCKRAYSGAPSVIDHRSVCAGLAEGGKDSCQGDSGGPLVAKTANGRFVQVGVVSFGKYCALKDGYGVYSRVSAFKDWIESNAHIDPFQPNTPASGPVASAAPSPSAASPPTSAPAPPASLSASTSDNAAGIQLDFVQGQNLKVGQKAQFRVSAARPGYLVLLDVAPGGKLVQIFPNKRSLASPVGGRPRSNFIEAGRTITVPDPNNPYEGFVFTADLPAGDGALLAILSDEPLQSVLLPDTPLPMDQRRSMDYLARLTAELGRDLEIQGTNKSSNWSFVTKPYKIVQ
jgi:secreted trypsin-like serine protease